jgi:hypothetical protein
MSPPLGLNDSLGLRTINMSLLRATWDVVNLRQDSGAAGIGPPREDFSMGEEKSLVRHYPYFGRGGMLTLAVNVR